MITVFPPEVSVFILSWNNIDTIFECFKTAQDDLIKNGITHEFIIVDNGSNDGSQEHATIRNKENQGISHGKNKGIESCEGSYIIMLDADVIPVPNSLFCLVDYMRTHPKTDALGFFPQKWTNQRNSNGQKHHETYCDCITDIQEIQKACIYYGIFRRAIFDEGLRFDAGGSFGKVGYGWEDSDFFLEMRKRGINQYAGHINSARGVYFHAINSSIRAMGRQQYIDLCKDRETYFKAKWGDDWKDA